MSELRGSRRGLPQQVKMRHDAHFVEDLTVRQEEPIGRRVLLADIEPNPGQPRGYMGDLTELIASIEEKGVLEPILVRPNPKARSSKSSRPYLIISGERRFQAAQEAGLVELPVIEMEVNEQEALEIALVENLQRKDLTPFEEGEGYRRLAEYHGYTHERIAEVLGKSRTLVSECLALLEMPAKARDAAIGLGIQSKSVLLEIVKATDDEVQIIALLEKVARQGLTRDDLRAAARSKRPSRGTSRAAPRQKPYTFKFKAPDKTYNLSLRFRRSTVERGDLITALEEILEELRTTQDPF